MTQGHESSSSEEVKLMCDVAVSHLVWMDGPGLAAILFLEGLSVQWEPRQEGAAAQGRVETLKCTAHASETPPVPRSSTPRTPVTVS